MSEQVQHTPGPSRCAARRDENDPRWALQPGVVREMVEALEWFMQRSGLNDSEVDGLLIPPGDAAEIQRRFGAVLAKVRGEGGDAHGS